MRDLNRPLPEDLQAQNEALSREVLLRASSEEVLRTKVNRFTSLLDGVADYAIFMLDPEGRVLTWNQCACRLLGYVPNDILGKHHSCLFSKTDCGEGKPEAELKQAVSEGRSQQAGIRIRKDGTSFWTEVVVSPIYGDSGDLRGFAKVVHDISDRKKVEEDLDRQAAKVSQRTAELEAANKELENFTYSVSHDLRAPLRHIGGFSQLLAEEFGATLPPEAQRYLSRITQGSKKMGVLIDELLGLAGIGRHSLSVQSVSLNLLVIEIIAVLAPETEGRIVEWKIGDLGYVDCDPVLIGQVFQNLISNAIKFSRLQAHAVIEIGRIADAQPAVFFVRDNGVGFDMKYADKLFGIFQRLHRIDEFEGTGIGLATVRRIIQKHAGLVWAQAEIGKGATFFFSVNLASQPEPDNNPVLQESGYESRAS